MPSGPWMLQQSANSASMSSVKAAAPAMLEWPPMCSMWWAALRPLPPAIMCRKEMKWWRTCSSSDETGEVEGCNSKMLMRTAYDDIVVHHWFRARRLQALPPCQNSLVIPKTVLSCHMLIHSRACTHPSGQGNMQLSCAHTRLKGKRFSTASGQHMT